MTVLAAIALVIAWIIDFVSWQHALMGLPLLFFVGICEAAILGAMSGGDDDKK